MLDEEATDPVGGASSELPAAQAARATVEAMSQWWNDESCMARTILGKPEAGRQTPGK